MVQTGLYRFLNGALPEATAASLGLIAHPASVTADLTHAADALVAAGFDLEALFGPQHGARGEKQDNMIESDPFVDARTGLPVHSLYGEFRKPTPEMLQGLDMLLFDLQDVGVRIYTFVWTMALAMEACAEAGVRFVVLDRPNPIGGGVVEGPVLQPGFESFVGLHPLPMRHGLTAGEMARWLNAERGIGCDLEVVAMEGWRRSHWWDDTGLLWVFPSPNIPTPDTCTVYPGMVLLEGTNLSEGRGTTRPFEMVGAPFVDPYRLVDALNRERLPGIGFRPCWFEPTFHKHADQLCGGVQFHVTDRDALRSVRVAVELLSAVSAQCQEFAWTPPPYEYEHEIMPIDILFGSDRLRLGVDRAAGAGEILNDDTDGVEGDAATFRAEVGPYLLYD